MELNEIVTKADLDAMEKRILKKLAELVKPPKRKLSVDEACERLGGMRKKTLLYKASIGEIASYKVGKHLVFDDEGIDAYLEKVRRMSNDELARRAWK